MWSRLLRLPLFEFLSYVFLSLRFFFFRNRSTRLISKNRASSFKFHFVFIKPHLDNLLYNPQQLDSPEHYQRFGISEQLMPPERPVKRDALEEERTRLGLLLPAR